MLSGFKKSEKSDKNFRLFLQIFQVCLTVIKISLFYDLFNTNKYENGEEHETIKSIYNVQFITIFCTTQCYLA